MTASSFRVCYTGDSPPRWVLEQAAVIGMEFVPLGRDGRPVTQAGEAAERLALLQPAGYLMNHPCYGPYLSAGLADAAGGLALELGLVPAHLAAQEDAPAHERAAGTGTRRGLFGSTLGVVGLGQIGQRVAQLAAACGMRVCYASRTRRPDLEDLLGIEYRTLPELASACDHISIHTPIIATRGLIGHDVLSRARGISLVNNTADPRIVEPAALLDALRSGRVQRVAIEGRYPEPHQTALETYRAVLAGRRSRDELT